MHTLMPSPRPYPTGRARKAAPDSSLSHGRARKAAPDSSLSHGRARKAAPGSDLSQEEGEKPHQVATSLRESVKSRTR